MNAKPVLHSVHLKCIFLACITFCGIIVFVLEHTSKTFVMKEPGMHQGFDTSFFPYDIRNYWYEKDLDVAIFILSAVASNTTKHVTSNRDIRLHGWLDSNHHNKRIKCCFLWSNGTISNFYDPEVIKQVRARNVASQIACPLNSSHSDVSGVTVTSANSTCPSADDELYIKPFIPKKAKTEESFAICLKLVYQEVDDTLFIDWLEFHRKMLVDKVFAFTYNVSETTEKIIRRYVDIGFLETRPFDRPHILQPAKIGEKTVSFWEDEVVIIFDCLQRAQGYKYMAIVDMDEFLLPRIHGNVKELMKYLMWKNPNAAGFQLISYIFDKNVNLNSPHNGSDIVKYFRRTRELSHTLKNSRKKNILLPSRITANGLRSHVFQPTKPYIRVNVSSTIVSLNHYRTCYENLKEFCSGPLFEDKDILRFVET